MDMLNVVSTGIFTILALIVNFNETHAKNERHRQKSVAILSAVSLH